MHGTIAISITLLLLVLAVISGLEIIMDWFSQYRIDRRAWDDLEHRLLLSGSSLIRDDREAR